MKYFMILILIGFTAITFTNTAYGLWVPQSPEKLFEQSETVFVGTVTFVNEIEFERSNTFHIEENGVPRIEIENYTQTLDEYTVYIEEFLKNPQESNTITMLEATVGGVPGRSVSIGGFELGDRVLFYVPKIDGTNQYSPESFKIPKQCNAKSALEQPRIEGGNSFNMIQEGIVKENNFIANKSIQFVYRMDMRSLDEKNFDFKITIRKETDAGKFGEVVLSETIPVKSKICEWIATATAEFVPQVGNYQMGIHTTEITGSSTFGGNFSVEENSGSYDEIISPLKQIKSGISTDEIKCKETLVLLQKYDGSPACVTKQSIQKLVDRGWTKYKDGITVQFSYCGSDGFDSKGNLNKSNSTHIWDENECMWQEISNILSGNNLPLPEFPSIESLQPEDRLRVGHKAGYTVISITLSSWDEYGEWESSRGSEHAHMPPIPITENTIDPIVFDMLYEMWIFEDYQKSEYDQNLYVKTIQKDYSVPNHHGIHDWLESEHISHFGQSNSGFSNHFEFRDNIYRVEMIAID